MIKFEHNNGDLSCAVFAGGIDDLCAGLCFEMSLIYGSIYKESKEAAATFKRDMIMSVVSPEIADKVFSPEIYDAITKSPVHTCGSFSIADKEEFERQLRELMNEDK